VTKTLDKPKADKLTVADLPNADDHPLVKDIIARHVGIVKQLSDAKQERASLWNQLPQEAGVIHIGSADARRRAVEVAIEARRLAGCDPGSAEHLAAVSEVKTRNRLDELDRSIEELTAADELVGHQLRDARMRAASDLEAGVRAVAEPARKEFAAALLAALASWRKLAALVDAIRRKGLPTGPAAAPVNPFDRALIGADTQTATNNIGRLIARFVTDGIFDQSDADEWRAKFPGCG